MTAVWYDPDCDQIWISNREESFPPRTLATVVDGAGLIHIRRRGQAKTLAGGAYTDLTDGEGRGFASNAEALAYLEWVFARPSGQAGGTEIAPVAIGGHRVISRTADGIVYASSDNPGTLDAVLGLTQGASEAGTPITYRREGPVDEPSWAWTLGPVFLGLDGGLTQSAPTRGAVLQIGIAPSLTRLLLDIQEPYFLAS